MAGWPSAGPLRGWSWDFDLVDARCGGALGDEERQQRESFALGFRFNRPPECVAAGAARADRRLVAKRTLVASERGEDDSALLRVVAMVKQVAEQAAIIARRRYADIGVTP